MSFKIIFTIAVAFLCGVQAQTEIDCDFPDNNPENCDTSSYLSHFTCRDDGELCTCLAPDGENIIVCEEEVTDNYESLDAEQCEALCTADADCRFYKHTTIRSKKECFLMNDSQCVAAADGECNPDHCDSGYVIRVPDEECADNTGGGDDGIIDKKYTCPTGSKQETSIMPDNYLKWTCYDMHHNRVNIYEGGDESAPGGTNCYSRPEMCNGKDYEYKCNKGSDDTTGVWEAVGEDPGAVDENTAVLKDVICNAADLVLSKAIYDQDGLEIQCVEVGGNGGVIEVTDTEATVMAQGNCLLLCDWYPILNFYTRDDTWYWKEMDCGAQDCPELEMTDDPNDVIYCWETSSDTTAAPTEAPTDPPTDAPTDAPTNAPTDAPTDAPSEAP